MKSRKYVNALILLVPIGLVAVPVLRAGIRSEVAHWYLAAAANAVEIGKGDPESVAKAEKAIEAARAWDSEVGKLPDYLTVRLLQFRASETKLSLAEIFKDVPADRRSQVAEQLAKQYFGLGDFGLAAEVMQILLGEEASKQRIYWLSLIYQDLLEVSEAKAVQTLQAAMASNPENPKFRELANQIAETLSLRDDFASTLEAHKLWLGEKFDRNANNLNSYAYARALAKVELDQALVDINEALGFYPNEPALRDTRAWVYYQLGRYEEAFADADFSVKAQETPSMTNWWDSTLESLLETKELSSTAKQEAATDSSVASDEPVAAEVTGIASEGDQPPIVMLDPPKNYLTRSQISASVWSLGVMRFHRAMILEKLGRSEDAEADWKWIEDNRLPPDERLH